MAGTVWGYGGVTMQSDDQIAASSQALFAWESHLFQAVDLFPIPIGVFLPDGGSAFFNRAFQACFGIPSDRIVRKLNVLNDPYIRTELGLAKPLQRAFAGEMVSLPDIRVPLEEILRRYGPGNSVSGITAMYQSITCFPVWNQEGKIAYIVSMFFTTRVYAGQPHVAKAREFMENNWREEFDMGGVADAVRLSRYHFARLFKKHVGMTPYCYYQNIKVQKLKEALRDTELSIAQAFAACGLEYSGNFARVFKDKVGMTPSQYRKTFSG